MKKVVLFGAGQTGAMMLRLLSPEYEPICFSDNSSTRIGTEFCHLPVFPLEEALAFRPDAVILCAIGSERTAEMEEQLSSLGYTGEMISSGVFKTLDPRCAAMRLLSEQISQRNIPGDAAELGVVRGDFALQINRALPDRILHLFDTFQGFSETDIAVEQSENLSSAKTGDFSETSESFVLARLPHADRAVIHKGYFPDTFAGCEKCTFCLVSIDADLYAPTAAALPLFYDRLSPGGALILHDVNGTQYNGAKKAVDEFCRERSLFTVPLCDLHGTVVLMK